MVRLKLFGLLPTLALLLSVNGVQAEPPNAQFVVHPGSQQGQLPFPPEQASVGQHMQQQQMPATQVPNGGLIQNPNPTGGDEFMFTAEDGRVHYAKFGEAGEYRGELEEGDAPLALGGMSGSVRLLWSYAGESDNDEPFWITMAPAEEVDGIVNNQGVNEDLPFPPDNTEPKFPPPPPPRPRPHSDPLVLDLNGDGIKVSTLNNGLYFDVNGDGIEEWTAWPTGVDDYVLCMDKDGDGVINHGVKELFGYVPEDYETNNDLTNGFKQLALYDENGDGYITPADKVTWSRLRLWNDKNRNGLVDVDRNPWANELITLDQADILEISLNYHERAFHVENGTRFREVAEFVRVMNGSKVKHSIVNIWFIAHFFQLPDQLASK